MKIEDYMKALMQRHERERRDKSGIEDRWFDVIPQLKEIENEMFDLIEKASSFETFDEKELVDLPNVKVIREFLKDVMFLGTYASNILGELEGDLPYED